MKKTILLSLLCFVVGTMAFYSCRKDKDIAPTVIPTQKKLIKVPLTRQALDYTCGASAFQSILYYYGYEYMESDVAYMVESDTTNGTKYAKIKEVAESLDFTVEVKKNSTFDDLKKYLDAGKPVIILIQAWTEDPATVDWKNDWYDGHYVVAIGYDNDKVYFMDPSTLGNYTYIPTQEFLDRWHDVDGNNDTCRNFIMSIQKLDPAYDPSSILKID